MCECFKISNNTLYTWLKKEMTNKTTATETPLRQLIKKIFADNKQVYGSYRIKAELEKQGVVVSRPYVARLMKTWD